MFGGTVLSEFTNVGYAGRRSFPGMPKTDVRRHRLAPRGAVRLDLSAGDVLSILPQGPEQTIALVVLDPKGVPGFARLGVTQNRSLCLSDFDSGAFQGWVAGQGGTLAQTVPTCEIVLDDLAVWAAQTACTAWVVRPKTPADLTFGLAKGAVDVHVKPALRAGVQDLPQPLGEIRDEFTVNRGTARSYVVQPGEFIQIIDVEGQQCSDFTALRRAPLVEGLEYAVDGTTTRSMVRSAYPGPGLLDKFYDADLRPMLRVIQDTCGRHDTFGVACTARGYEDRGFPGHLNCSDNLSDVLAPYGVRKRTAWPAVNFFWNTWVDHHSHQLMTEESHSRPGDYVVMKALDELVCASTACPDDLDPINGWNPTDVHVRIYRPEAPIRRAIAYREKENAPMSLSQESAFHPSTSRLTTHFAPARNLWSPVSYPSVGTIGEYWACRDRATLQDMSSLRKYDIVGPDAERLLQRAMTKDGPGLRSGAAPMP